VAAARAGRPLFAFLGHTDVVPPGPRELWRSDPFEPQERDGWLYGRGSADMKTSDRGVCGRRRALRPQPPQHPGGIALLLTSRGKDPRRRHRRGGRGAAARGQHVDFGLVGEPTRH